MVRVRQADWIAFWVVEGWKGATRKCHITAHRLLDWAGRGKAKAFKKGRQTLLAASFVLWGGPLLWRAISFCHEGGGAREKGATRTVLMKG